MSGRSKNCKITLRKYSKLSASSAADARATLVLVPVLVVDGAAAGDIIDMDEVDNDGGGGVA